MKPVMMSASLVLAFGCSDAALTGSGAEVSEGVQLLSQTLPTHPAQAPPEAIPFPDMGPGEQVSVCEGAESSECGECAPGFQCVAAFCGGEVCAPGHPCLDETDCPTGQCVRPDGAPPSVRGMCTSSNTCSQSRECALGFRCESGICVDRRIPCGFHSVGCPRGSICTFMPVEGRPYCVAARTPCDDDGTCEPGARCLDVDADGQLECSPAGTCSSNDECPAGFSCGVDPGTSQAACVVDGMCRGGDCPSGLTCLDTGSGRARCLRIGECARDSDCSAGSVCGAVHATDPLRCLTFDEYDGSDTL